MLPLALPPYQEIVGNYMYHQREKLNAGVLRTHPPHQKEGDFSIGMFPFSILTEWKYKLDLNV